MKWFMNKKEIISSTVNQYIFLLIEPDDDLLEFYAICPDCDAHFYITQKFHPYYYGKKLLICDCGCELGYFYDSELEFTLSYVN